MHSRSRVTLEDLDHHPDRPVMAIHSERHPSRHQVKTMMRIVLLHFGALLSEELRLDAVGKAPAPCDSGSSRNYHGCGSPSTWSTLPFMDQVYATGLCRARPQRRQRERRFDWSTFKSSGVSKWPFPQIQGMVIGSRIRSGETCARGILSCGINPDGSGLQVLG